MAMARQAPSIKALGLPDGANCQRRVNMREVSEKLNKKDIVGHGFVVPIATYRL